MQKKTSPLQRETSNPQGLFLREGDILTIAWDDFYKEYNVSGAIRLLEKDFSLLPTTGLFTHFNLEVSHHQVTSIYLLIRIVKQGWYRENKEVLPVLDPRFSMRAKCLSVKEFVPYDLIQTSDFKYSLPTIQTVDDLKREILFRYRESLPELTEKQILERGVSITTLEMVNN